jgi:Uma2 family endonuclease
MYAEAGISEFWIVNLEDDCLEVYRQPTSAGVYNETRYVHRLQTVDIAALRGSMLAVDDIL